MEAYANERVSSEKYCKNDLWVDKYRPEKFTQLITMDVSDVITCNF